jgi:predicted transcriptional regulator of viral defense system
MRIDILTCLAKKDKTFTFEEALKISGLPRGSLKKVIYRLEQRGAIERIEKGKYMNIPLGAEKGKYTLNEFVIGSLLVNPYSVAYWSALNFYGLTEQFPNAKTAPRNPL